MHNMSKGLGSNIINFTHKELHTCIDYYFSYEIQ